MNDFFLLASHRGSSSLALVWSTSSSLNSRPSLLRQFLLGFFAWLFPILPFSLRHSPVKVQSRLDGVESLLLTPIRMGMGPIRFFFSCVLILYVVCQIFFLPYRSSRNSGFVSATSWRTRPCRSRGIAPRSLRLTEPTFVRVMSPFSLKYPAGSSPPRWPVFKTSFECSRRSFPSRAVYIPAPRSFSGIFSISFLHPCFWGVVITSFF